MGDAKVEWFCCGMCNCFLDSLSNYNQHFHFRHTEVNDNKNMTTPPPGAITILPSQVHIRKLPDSESEEDEKRTTRNSWSPHPPRRTKDEQIMLPCVICNMDFKNTTYLHRHIRTRHIKETPFQCGRCEKSFSRADTLKSHSRMHSNKMYFSCEHCAKEFKFLSNFNEHMSYHHTADKDRRKFPCIECPSHFFTQEKLDTHRGKVHNIKRARKFQCNICPKSFFSITGLKNHILVHTAEKHFKCDLCSKTFIQKSNLTTHKKSHERNRARPLSCQKCDKSFITKQHFQYHIDSVHERVEKFHCSICNKGFTHKLPLESHLKSHVAERHHKCQFCEKSFKHASSLKMHIRLHLGEKPYRCEKCGKGYTQRVNMEKHKEICGKTKGKKNRK